MEKFKKIQELVRSSRRVAVICHQNADPDSLCSGFGLSHLLRNIRKGLKVELIAPGGVSKVSRVVMSRFPIKISGADSLEAFDLLFTVDTNTIQQLGDMRPSIEKAIAPIIVVDHHAPDPRTRKLARILVCNQRASSTAEIIHYMSKKFRVRWSRTVAQALLTGMVYDSNHFALALPAAFRAAIDLIDAGANPKMSVSLLRLPMDESERMARIKAAQRVKLRRVADWVIVTSHVNSHQASAARALIMLGADVAVVAGERKEELRISLRSTEKFYDETGVHLGTDIARVLGEATGGMGGGHALASGVAGKGEVENILEYSATLLERRLNETKPSI